MISTRTSLVYNAPSSVLQITIGVVGTSMTVLVWQVGGTVGVRVAEGDHLSTRRTMAW